MLLVLAAETVLSVAAQCSILPRPHPGGRLRRGGHRLLVSLSMSQVEVQVLICKEVLILFNGPSVR